LDQQIRQLCRHVLSAQGAEFALDVVKLDTALALREEIKEKKERKAPSVVTPLVLVVDDEPSIVSTVCAILHVYGFRTLSATSGPEAIAKAAGACPDLLLCDVIMPGMNGFQTALQVKKLCPQCRLLFFTGYAAVADLAEGLKNDGHDFEMLSKPLPPAVLVDRVKAVLAAS